MTKRALGELLSADLGCTVFFNSEVQSAHRDYAILIKDSLIMVLQKPIASKPAWRDYEWCLTHAGPGWVHTYSMKQV